MSPHLFCHASVAILGPLTAQSICIRFVNNIIVTLKVPKSLCGCRLWTVGYKADTCDKDRVDAYVCCG